MTADPCPCCGAAAKLYEKEVLAVGVQLPERWECECYCWQRTLCLRCEKCVRHCECIKGQKKYAPKTPAESKIKQMTQRDFFEEDL